MAIEATKSFNWGFFAHATWVGLHKLMHLRHHNRDPPSTAKEVASSPYPRP